MVGKTNGNIDILALTSLPFSATYTDSYQPQNNDDRIIDMDFSYDNTKLLICFSNDNDLSVVTNWATSGSRSHDQKDITDDHVACKWSKNDDAVVADVNLKVRVFPVSGAGVIGG